MTWEITVNYDKDQDNVGTVNATWTDPNFGVFNYSKRIKATAAGANAYVDQAIAERDEWQTKQAANIAGQAIVKNKIDSADPQVGA